MIIFAFTCAAASKTDSAQSTVRLAQTTKVEEDLWITKLQGICMTLDIGWTNQSVIGLRSTGCLMDASFWFDFHNMLSNRGSVKSTRKQRGVPACRCRIDIWRNFFVRFEGLSPELARYIGRGTWIFTRLHRFSTTSCRRPCEYVSWQFAIRGVSRAWLNLRSIGDRKSMREIVVDAQSYLEDLGYRNSLEAHLCSAEVLVEALEKVSASLRLLGPLLSSCYWHCQSISWFAVRRTLYCLCCLDFDRHCLSHSPSHSASDGIENHDTAG